MMDRELEAARRNVRELEAIRRAARKLVAVAAPLWGMGDGYGGWVHSIVDEAADEIGLPVEEPR